MFAINESLRLPEADLELDSQFIPAVEADVILEQLLSDIDWQQRSITLFGKTIPQPRLTAWYGDPGAAYRYSGLYWEPLPWTPLLRSLKNRIEQQTGLTFNSVLLNLYRHGQDSMGWHSDDEPELGKNPAIASLSFGASRRFLLRHRQDKTLKQTLHLGHGSLLLMKGETQHHWHHQLPKTPQIDQPRVNLTFRQIVGLVPASGKGSTT